MPMADYREIDLSIVLPETGGSFKLSPSAMEAVRLKFNPSNLDDVSTLKILAAAFITQCEIVDLKSNSNAREMATAKTNAQTASMWAVLGATKDL